MKEMRTHIGGMSSQEAADWLMKTYPAEGGDYGIAIALLTHKSWGRADQIRLAGHYLKKIPFASPKVYEAFASFMSTASLLRVIEQYVPKDRSDISLLLYHLRPVLEKSAKNERDRELVRSFISRVQ